MVIRENKFLNTGAYVHAARPEGQVRCQRVSAASSQVATFLALAHPFLANLASSRFRKAPQWRIPCGASRERARHAIQDPDTVPFCSCQTPFNKQSSFSGAIKRNHQPPRPRLHVADFSMRSRSISPVVTEAKLVPEQMFREGSSRRRVCWSAWDVSTLWLRAFSEVLSIFETSNARPQPTAES